MNNRQYIIKLEANRFRQILKSDRTKTRDIDRISMPLTSLEKLIKDPLASCGCRTRGASLLRRHGVAVLLTVCLSWVVLATIAILQGAQSRLLLSIYSNSITFWSCAIQAMCAAFCTRLAIIARRREVKKVASRIAKMNVGAAVLAAVLAGAVAAEGAGGLGGLGNMDNRGEEKRLVNVLTVAALGAAMILHANLAIRAKLAMSSHGSTSRSESRSEKAERRARAFVSPLSHQPSDSAGSAGSDTSPSSPTSPSRKSQSPNTRGSASGDKSPNTRGVASAEGTVGTSSFGDDARRVVLDPHEMPADDRSYIMYHGTRPEAAERIEKYGFTRSADGMLGEGVYLSRDVTKAAHYPLDVADNDVKNRVILECLVHVGKVPCLALPCLTLLCLELPCLAIPCLA